MAGIVMIQGAYPPTIPATSVFRTIQVNSILKSTDLILSGTLTANAFSDGIATLSGGTLTGLIPPVDGSDATNKDYVDGLIVGRSWKSPVQAASVSNLILSGIQTIDGVILVSNDRVLVKDQTNPIENGIYIVNTGIWSRSDDLEIGSTGKGMVTVVNGGTVNNNAIYQCKDGIIVGTDALTYGTISGGGTGTPGGSNTNIQFNSSGNFGGTNDLTWDGSTMGLNGILNVDDTTESTSDTTGCVVLDGGLGLAKNINCGGTITAVEFVATSDATLKMDVYPIDNPLKKLEMMDPVQYRLNFTKDGCIHYGVLAQDLQDQGLGNIVKQTGDHLSVNYNDIVGILIGAVQELKNEVQELKKLLT